MYIPLPLQFESAAYASPARRVAPAKRGRRRPAAARDAAAAAGCAPCTGLLLPRRASGSWSSPFFLPLLLAW
jgi:ribosomal protein L32